MERFLRWLHSLHLHSPFSGRCFRPSRARRQWLALAGSATTFSASTYDDASWFRRAQTSHRTWGGNYVVLTKESVTQITLSRDRFGYTLQKALFGVILCLAGMRRKSRWTWFPPAFMPASHASGCKSAKIFFLSACYTDV